jgi:hypothetical protein
MSMLGPTASSGLYDNGIRLLRKALGSGQEADAAKFTTIVDDMFRNRLGGSSGTKRELAVGFVALTAVLVTLERMGKLIATGGEKAVINKHSKKGLKAVSGKIGDKARGATEWLDDTIFATKGRVKRLFSNPEKKAAKAAKKAEKAALKAETTKKTVSVTA